MFFPQFTEWDVAVDGGVTIHGRSGGAGPAIVLLHGHPRAHTTWHLVAPQLVAAGFTVVCPDLRGYGRSSKPQPDERHLTYGDRAMAADVVQLMDHLGHSRFTVIGHDRGQGVAHRTALDHPDRVSALGVLDGIPLLEHVERVDARFATEWWHWFFFAGSPHAERVINADPDAWYGLGEELAARMGDENYQYVAAALHEPDTVRAMLEDYRAGLSVDAENDRRTRNEGQTIACPTLVAWSVHDDIEDLYGDPVAIWRSWVSGPITSARIDSGHHMAEENPDQLARVVAEFVGGLSS
jgi:haloacetate dehalogenase